MQNDLQDALTAWQGGEVPAGRAEELLARLRTDEEFRRIFAEEIWVLSLTRMAQAPSPRWLALCDELGITPVTGTETQLNLERNVMAGVEKRPLQVVRSWWRLAAIGTTALAAVLMVFLAVEKPRPSFPASGPVVVQADPVPLAVVLQAFAQWSSDQTPVPEKGREMMSGSRLTFESGSLTLMFRSGVILQAEGPADLELLSAYHVVCHRGRVRTKVPKGAEGFRVQVPEGHITDLGTEMGVNVEDDGRTRVAVFEGLAEASLHLRDQDGMRTESVGAREAMELLPQTGELRKSNMEDFLPATELKLPDLIMRGDYSSAILKTGPRHYWRLNRATTDGLVPDEIQGGAPLRLGSGVSLQPNAMGMVNAEIAEDAAGPALLADGPWVAKRSGWAIELWFVSRNVEQSTLAAFSENDLNPRHAMLVEYSSHDPVNERRRSLRFLVRWPVETRGGVNLYSKPTFLPYQWHHVVAQQQDRHMELWVDGRLTGKGVADEMPEKIRGVLVFGNAIIKAPVTHEPTPARRLSGRMAEIAVYDRMLTAEEILGHAAIGGKRPATP